MLIINCGLIVYLLDLLEVSMLDVVVVRLLSTKGIYYLSPNLIDVKIGDKVVFESENGIQLGEVCKGIYKEKSENLNLPLKKVIRIALDDDIASFDDSIKITEKALNDARKLCRELNLDMNFVEAYYNLDRTQLIFSFLSDNRVDFRELAKKLAQKYKTRIELRQIGVRDKSKKIGGLGPCGLFLCCNSFLTDFNSVSINMAKNQLLALNPSKINGVCGRLLCCLDYENDIYTELKKNLPKLGMVAETPLGIGKVVSIDVFKKTYSVDLKEKGIVEFNKDDNKDGNVK